MNHVALLVNLVSLQQKTVRPVFQNQQTRVERRGTLGGNVADTINGLVDTGISIQIATELNTQRTGEFDDAVALEVFRTVEGHVLEEVSQTAL